MKKFWIILVAIAALVLVGAPANATGSDGIPPYDVGQEGITLPGGGTLNPWHLGAGFGLLVLGSVVMFARRRESV